MNILGIIPARGGSKGIPQKNIRKIGTIGQIVDDKRGSARNYLFSKKKELFASKENKNQVEKIKKNIDKKK